MSYTQRVLGANYLQSGRDTCLQSVTLGCAGRAGAGMAVCNGSLYLVAGYSANKHHPADVWLLPQHAVTAKPSRLQKASAIPEEVTPHNQAER